MSCQNLASFIAAGFAAVGGLAAGAGFLAGAAGCRFGVAAVGAGFQLTFSFCFWRPRALERMVLMSPWTLRAAERTFAKSFLTTSAREPGPFPLKTANTARTKTSGNSNFITRIV